MTLKRTYKRDKRSGRMIETTPEHVKALLPKRKRKPGVPYVAKGIWPMRSKVMGCHPSQAAQFNEYARAANTGVSYAPNGDLIIPSKAAKDRHLRMSGQTDDTFDGE